jgi:ribosome modulation factor
MRQSYELAGVQACWLEGWREGLLEGRQECRI